MNPLERLLPRSLNALLTGLVLLSSQALAETKTITLLQTTDIHGQFVPGALTEGSGDWLRLATLITRERGSAGKENVLLIDCGDTCQGSWVTAHSRGEIAAQMLVALKYDVWVPGNHDLDFGVARCRELCRTVGQATLCGNLTLTTNGTTDSWPAWRQFTRNGVRVAVIGATASYLDQWLWGKAMAGFQVTRAEAMLEALLPKVLASRPDMIVLALHQGWLEKDPRQVNEIPAITNRFPEIDLILGGHTHRPMSGRRIGARTWYVQAGEKGKQLGVIKATVDTEKHAVLQLESHLIDVTPDVPPYAATGDIVERLVATAATDESAQIGTLGAPLSSSGTPGETCQASELLCMAIAAKTKAQVVLHGRLSKGTLDAGPIRNQDLFMLVPYENAVGIAELDTVALTTILEEQARNRKSYVYNGPWGIVVRVDHRGKVTALEWPDGRAVAPGTKLRVALNSYTIAGGGGRFPELRRILAELSPSVQDTGLMTRQILKEYVATRDGLKIERRRWLFRQRKPRSRK